MSDTGLAYEQYKIGPKTEPYGIPKFSSYLSGNGPLVFTHCSNLISKTQSRQVLDHGFNTYHVKVTK